VCTAEGVSKKSLEVIARSGADDATTKPAWGCPKSPRRPSRGTKWRSPSRHMSGRDLVLLLAGRAISSKQIRTADCFPTGP